MKVAFLITKLDHTGAPKMLAWVANQFAKAGHDVYVLSLYSQIIGQPLESNINFISLNLSQSENRLYRNSLEVVFDVKKIDYYMNFIKPDLIISFLYQIDFYYILFNKLFRKRKMLVSMRVDPFFEHGLSSMIKHWITTLADGCVFQTNGAKSFYPKSLQEKSVVIPNPITKRTLSFSDSVKEFSERKNIIVLPARFYLRQKRQDVMLNAFSIISKLHPEYKLVFLGDGPDEELLRDLIVKSGMADKIEIHSPIKSAEMFTKNCKIMVLTSDFEGIPNALLESMAIGLNVVSTDCSPGGARELINDGQNGYIVERGNVNAIAEKVLAIIGDENNANRMAKNAKKIALKLSEDKIAGMWTEYAKKLLFK